ncbi:Uncharacterised protein [Candidatus Venteria ishoeyi]|uniref:Uncharacterized protein n=1 Tax=Candidatus Venteria ishoeyi TaxID=1899563 RepID=A0A1H6F756_9GAMM|nr:Uncharacterised protein [Candidatus Venteria ishoeyi]
MYIQSIYPREAKKKILSLLQEITFEHKQENLFSLKDAEMLDILFEIDFSLGKILKFALHSGR